MNMTYMQSFKYMVIIFLMQFSISLLAQRHIVVHYDVSGSMYPRNQLKMNDNDFERLNQYLLDLLYQDVKVQTRAPDSVTSEYTGEVRGPLLGDQDVLTLILVETDTKILLRRDKPSRQDLEELLPKNKDDFRGRDTYLKRAKVEMYRNLVREEELTFFILISDEDEDRSDYERRNAEVEAELLDYAKKFEELPVMALLVNNYVAIKVDRIGERGRLIQQAVESARAASLARIEALEKELETQISQERARAEEDARRKIEAAERERDREIATIREQAKSDIEDLEKRMAEARSDEVREKLTEERRTLEEEANQQIASLREDLAREKEAVKKAAEEEAEERIAEVRQAAALEIEAAKTAADRRADARIREIENASREELETMRKENEKSIEDANERVRLALEEAKRLERALEDKTAAIVFLALSEKPFEPVTSIAFPDADDRLRSPMLMITSENRSGADQFEFDRLELSVINAAGTLLYEDSRDGKAWALDQELQLELPAENKIVHQSNTLRLRLTYSYKGKPYDESFDVSYSVVREFPKWVIPVLILVVILAALAFFLRAFLSRSRGPRSITLTLTEVSASGSELGRPASFDMVNDAVIAFEADGEGDDVFDVKSPGYLKNISGGLIFYQSDEDEAPASVGDGETIHANDHEGKPVYVRLQLEEEQDEDEDDTNEAGNDDDLDDDETDQKTSSLLSK